MGMRIAWTIVAMIIVGAAVSAMFRVATAPDRIKERRNIAKEVCVKSGGEWVTAGRDEVCKRG
jgi:molybdopterin synthase catalytic subunit